MATTKKEIKKPIAKSTVSKKTTVKEAVTKPVKEAVVTSKPVKSVSKRATAKAERPHTMRNRSGLHINNPRRVASKEAGITVKVAVVGVDGVSKGNMSLPVEIFGATPNKNLVAQAVRVYLANQRQGTSSTKTRSEVTGSTRKIYRQKGTGRARHGAAKGPIFVGGGIVFGPHPQDYSLKFPKKMKKVALIHALSQKAQEGVIKIIDGEFSGKTKEVAVLMKKMELNKKGIANKVLFVADKNAMTVRGAHNLDGLKIESAATLSTYGVVISHNLVFMKSALTEITTRLTKKD